MSRNIIFVLIHHCHKLLDLNRLNVQDSHLHDQGSSLCLPIHRRVPSFPAPLILLPWWWSSRSLRTVGTDVSDYMVPHTSRQKSSIQVYQFQWHGLFKQWLITLLVGGDLQDGFWIGWLDLLHHAHSHNSGLQVIQRYRCPPLHMH
jgi:hypothetical protein